MNNLNTKLVYLLIAFRIQSKKPPRDEVVFFGNFSPY